MNALTVAHKIDYLIGVLPEHDSGMQFLYRDFLFILWEIFIRKVPYPVLEKFSHATFTLFDRR